MAENTVVVFARGIPRQNRIKHSMDSSSVFAVIGRSYPPTMLWLDMPNSTYCVSLLLPESAKVAKRQHICEGYVVITDRYNRWVLWGVRKRLSQLGLNKLLDEIVPGLGSTLRGYGDDSDNVEANRRQGIKHQLNLVFYTAIAQYLAQTYTAFRPNLPNNNTHIDPGAGMGAERVDIGLLEAALGKSDTAARSLANLMLHQEWFDARRHFMSIIAELSDYFDTKVDEFRDRPVQSLRERSILLTGGQGDD